MAQKLLKKRLLRTEVLTDLTTTRSYLVTRFSTREHEIFGCLFLNNRHRVIELREMFRGTIDGASVYPREVVKASLQLNATAVIFVHNHPSGDPKPSAADKALTSRLRDALSVVDVRVLDHFVIGGTKAFSFVEKGLI